MKAKNVLASLVAVFVLALVVLSSNVTAAPFAQITEIYVDGVSYDFGNYPELSRDAGETVAIKVVFNAVEDASDVRVYSQTRGTGGIDDSTELFRVIAGNRYEKTLFVQLPRDLDETHEGRIVQVFIEKENGQGGVWEKVYFDIQRKSYDLEILSVETMDEASAGETLALDVVLRNVGFEESEDNYVEAVIPELGARARVYFGDLSEIDQPIREEGSERLNKEDAVERRVYLKIPSNAASGVYDIEISAFNSDSSTLVKKKIVVLGAEEKIRIISPLTAMTVGTGEEADYSMTLVNAGNEIQIYEFVLDSDSALNVDASDLIVVVPAGTSKTVRFTASAAEEGSYGFAVNVHSDGKLVQTENYMVKVEGGSVVGTNAAVVLTIILAIIFAVLLIVLIVLLTRKPETNEDFGESYY